MYDPATPTFVIRLAEVEGLTIGHLAMERADILAEMEALNVRLVEVDNLLNTKHAQAQPIPASVTLTDNDFWTNRHRTMSGRTPLVARTNGYVSPLVRVAPRQGSEVLHEDDGA